MQRGEALRYMRPARLAPLHHRPAWGNHSRQVPSSQVNRGPKKLGRSQFLGVQPGLHDTPFLASSGDIGAFLLGGMLGLFLSDNPRRFSVSHMTA